MCIQAKIIPLAKLKPGQKGRVLVTESCGGRGFLQHLSDMGINEGSEIEVITPGSPGPFLIAVNNTSLAIGQGVASKIIVEQNV